MATENRLPQTTVLQRGVEQPNGVGVVMQRGSFNVRERKSNVDSLTWTIWLAQVANVLIKLLL